MTVASRLVLAALLAAVAAPAGVAQEASKPLPVHLPPAILVARSWDEAIKEATIRNVPILFTTAMAT